MLPVKEPSLCSLKTRYRRRMTKKLHLENIKNFTHDDLRKLRWSSWRTRRRSITTLQQIYNWSYIGYTDCRYFVGRIRY